MSKHGKMLEQSLHPQLKPEAVQHYKDLVKQFKPPPMSGALELSPARPRVGGSYLQFFSALTVSADPQQEYVLFSSAFPGPVFPSIQLQFEPLQPGKSHLVELHVQLFAQKPYKFRKFWGPSFDYEDLSDDNASVISILVPAVPDWTYPYDVELQQRNTPEEQAGWLFSKARITALS